ncbi:MAG: hypothetical protein QXP77_02765 [Candidatus Aenigmatarchaeota archaeon]
MAEEKIITVNLRKELMNKARWKKKKLAVKALREILERKLKKKVKIDKSLNEKIFGSEKKFKTKIRIKLEKRDDETFEAKIA